MMKNKTEIINALRVIKNSGGDYLIAETKADWGRTHSYLVSTISLYDDDEEMMVITRKKRIKNSAPSRGVEFETMANEAGSILADKIEVLAEQNGMKFSIELSIRF